MRSLAKEESLAPDKSRAILQANTDDELLVIGYKTQLWRRLLLIFLSIVSLGALPLLIYWWPLLGLKVQCSKSNLAKADRVLVEDKYQKYTRRFVKKIHLTQSSSSNQPLLVPSTKGDFREVRQYRHFRVKKHEYIWDEVQNEFKVLQGLDQNVPLDLLCQPKGLSAEEQVIRRGLYGPNDIHVRKQSIVELLLKEVLNPYYVFEAAAVTLWYFDEYYKYATAIVIMTTISIVAAVYQTKSNEKRLRSTISKVDSVEVLRDNNNCERVSSHDLVPGDVFVVPVHGCELHCDAVLIKGSVVVNEAMLTGEGVPVTKTALPRSNLDFDMNEHQRSVLFNGTEVIQTRNYSNQRTLAKVIRTGYLTTKGNLVRSILYPPPVDFKFEQDSYKFIGFLALVASIGFLYTSIRKTLSGDSLRSIALDSLDLITIVVPPALPAAMTIGAVYAQKRLQRKCVACISPRTINVAGSVDCVAFDKTGTLTEDGLDLKGHLPVINNMDKSVFDQFVQDNNDKKKKIRDEIQHRELISAMATCHSLSLIKDELKGDPLDLKMFEATHFTLEQPPLGNDGDQLIDQLAPTVLKPPKGSQLSEMGLIRQFPFASSLQCMSVIVRGLDSDHFTIYCKGSPEKMLTLAKPETVPENFHSVLKTYTEEGCRVIAIGKRDLAPSIKLIKVERMERGDVERDLSLLGLIILQNRMKPVTKSIISELQLAKLRTLMVTGDNLYTALAVAKECGMVTSPKIIIVTAWLDNNEPRIHFQGSDGKDVSTNYKKNDYDLDADKTLDFEMAMDGATFTVVRQHFSDILDRLLVRCVVFARMKPEQKQLLMERLDQLQYSVAFCGDGANDCGALKSARVGVSLSEAEASVASPFTSSRNDISCVPELIREGRCALVTSFGIFKYMAGYSLTQFLSVMILYNFGSNLSDEQFLYIDLFLITVFAFFFGFTAAYEGPLSPRPPQKSLMSLTPICSLSLQVLTIALFQLLSLFIIQRQSFYVRFDTSNLNYSNTSVEELYANADLVDSEVACFENYAVFGISAFQYVLLALVFSKAKPYRRSIVDNIWLLLSFVLATAFNVYLVLAPDTGMQRNFELLLPPSISSRFILLALAVANVVVGVVLEEGLVEFVVFRRFAQRLRARRPKKHAQVSDWLRRNLSWPSLTPTSLSPTTDIDDLPVVNVDTVRVDVEAAEDGSKAFRTLLNNNNRFRPDQIIVDEDVNEDISFRLQPRPPS